MQDPKNYTSPAELYVIKMLNRIVPGPNSAPHLITRDTYKRLFMLLLDYNLE